MTMVAWRKTLCHPDRRHKAKGLCDPCYQRQRTLKPSACHPDRPHHAKGQCARCYNLARWHGSREIQRRALELRGLPENRARFNRRRQAWRRENIGERTRVEHDYKIRWSYGISRAELDALIIGQGGRCAICAEPDDNLFIDHDHKTGRIRGLLCLRCNWGIGQFNENVGLLASAIRYLATYPLPQPRSGLLVAPGRSEGLFDEGERPVYTVKREDVKGLTIERVTP